MSKNIFVGLSGGVDSSLSAALLRDKGYNVSGVYMKNWSQDLPGMKCPWQQDYTDAKRVAVQLGIPFFMYDFEKEYRHLVVDYMLNAYKSGLTPNPDIMCNQEIKFGLFLATALRNNADYIATGHYARVIKSKNGNIESYGLYEAVDKDKDQSYFLYRINRELLPKVIMPIGELSSKKVVRKLASDYKLVTADKKDSQGICFVGEVGIKDFLQATLGTQKPGKVLDQNGRVVGEHEGAIFYTIGQRHGLKLGGGLPYYVTFKNMDKNEVYVTTDLGDRHLWSHDINITSLHWLVDDIKLRQTADNLSVRARYRATKVPCSLTIKHQSATLKLQTEIRAVTPGQSAVIYQGEQVLGGGIIC